MNVWCFFSTILFWNALCNGTPATDIEIGLNCTGESQATRLYAGVESINSLEDHNAKRSWFKRMFLPEPPTIVDVVKTYPWEANKSCTITCIRVHDLKNTCTLLNVISGGLFKPTVSIRMVSAANEGLMLKITIDGFCNTPVSATNGQLSVGYPTVLPLPPAILPPVTPYPRPAVPPITLLPSSANLLPIESMPAPVQPALNQTITPMPFGWVRPIDSPVVPPLMNYN